MDFVSPTVKKQYSIQNILNDATSMLKKNGNRKVILLLDKHFMSYSQNDDASLNIQISRRLLKASQNLLIEYIQRDNISKVDLLLDRSNLYIAVLYINVQRKLKNEKGIVQYEELNSAQLEQRIGLSRLRQRIRQTICIPGNLIKATQLNRLKEKDKIKFYINECWVLLLKQLIIYAKIFKSTNEIPNSLRMMFKVDHILSIKEFHKRKNLEIMKVQIEHYQNSGQSYLQLREFRLSLQQYDLALKILQDLIFTILKKNNTPNVIDDNDLKPVQQYIMKIILILYLESLCYEYLSEYSQMKECIHLSQWLCSEVLRLEDEHQLHILIFSRAQDIQKYFEVILAECEIRHIIFSSFCDNNQAEMKAISAQIKEDYIQLLNEKFFLKFHHQKLHRQQFFKLNLKSPQSSQPYLLYSVPKGSRTERETTTQQLSKQYQSFTTQDGVEQQYSRKFIQVESETKLLKQNSLSSFSRKTRPTDFSQYCKTEQSDYPKLDQELAGVIVNQLKQEKPFFMLSDIQRTCEDEISENQRQQQDYELGKAVLMFKKQFSRNAITEPKEADSLKQLNNQIKTEFQLISGYLEAQEHLKRKKQKQKLFEQMQKPKQKKQTPLRKIFLKHSNTLGFKQIKKKLQHLEEESQLMKLYHLISDKKEGEKEQPKEDQILRKMIQTNLNAIKVIMDENQKQQETAQSQLRKRRPISVSAQMKPNIHPQSPQLRDVITDLAGSTQYLSTKGQSTKNVTSMVELANLKKKLNSIQMKSPIRYSQLFKKQ
ncbi:unnamed protein product (macronuclear) [Paramecium tetraurelia]|uniref:Uncharacterized protein n=1 Tax=Paramecium tetraurelia TaxID=5888 RepID=A0BDN6_PARTE|nr:uncharacterized protein GSPATT00027683001 [Paramecium tetraurelia]CAK56653.1 unnamed protein product [Paramecium tetraurelia]|eukprot:XP_001424051.1 hypothetical protein (macronuclear) [Paramecium tetraurelia strain d4-2]